MNRSRPLLDFFFGHRRDIARASAIIRYLGMVFEVKSRSITDPHYIQLRLNMAVVDVRISCRDGKLYITFEGFSDNNFEGHVPGQVERVREEIRSYLGASHAAKWRDRVSGI